MAGKTIKLFLTEGKPNGLTIAELQQWTGIALACPRSEVQKLTRRSEATKPGVYILTGPDEKSQLHVAYIGEAENIANRLKEHHRTLDFWDRICFFTQKDDNLTKGHVRYLETRMIQIAQKAKRMPLKNSSSPNPANIPLPESDLADMEYFLEQMQILLPVLGIDLLKPQPIVTDSEAKESTIESPLFEIKSKYAEGQAKLVDGEFVILKNSMARKECAAHFAKTGSEQIRQELISAGILIDANEYQYRLTENHAFSSPSKAAEILTARSTSGPAEWKVKDTGQSYGEWNAAKIDEAISNSN